MRGGHGVKIGLTAAGQDSPAAPGVRGLDQSHGRWHVDSVCWVAGCIETPRSGDRETHQVDDRANLLPATVCLRHEETFVGGKVDLATAPVAADDPQTLSWLDCVFTRR